jgi:uracil-DNA glycosylase family 4
MSDLLDCRACPRLAGFLDDVRQENPGYHARPVVPFGADDPRLLIVGLAPGMHGANRTGRPFTGDHAGILLYQTLHKFGFASRSVSESASDGLELIGCRITNAVKCLPPANKPETAEIKQCNAYLKTELASLQPGTAVLALGNVAHAAVLMALGLKTRAHPFGHGAVHTLFSSPPGRGARGEGALRLYDSYHCSRYNTQTRRLTTDMFHAVFARIRNDMEK